MGDVSVETTFNIIDLINLGIGLAITIAFALSVYYMFAGAISMILSGGQEDKIKEAVNTIRYAVIGLVITVLAVVFIFVIGNIFDINVKEYVNFDRILELLKGLFDRVVNGPNS
jgi:uncharacterized BrkB/YihY/UPF0761 family membrane protein